jgi:RNA polymerase sigma-70 factor (ECF subfamily)
MSVAHSDAAAADLSSLAALDDRELARRAAAGRREAFDALVERHQRTVYHLCYRFVGNHDDAADLAQEAFLRAYRGVRGFKGEASLSTWLYRIAVNVCLNRVTAKAPAFESLDAHHDLGAHGPDPSNLLLQRERAARVRAAIARLPPRQRAALVLRVYQELPHAEIARIVGGTVGAVKANFFHALHNLKRILATDPEWGDRAGRIEP